MIHTLRIIHLDDNYYITSLIQVLLTEEGFVCAIERVETETDFIALLERGEFDLVLSELTLSGMSGMTALAMSRQRYPDLPFIFVTDTMGEEVAIESLKSGATDYVLKCRLGRLGPSVKLALLEAEECEKYRENQLHHARKLEAVGRQSYGMDHDYVKKGVKR